MVYRALSAGDNDDDAATDDEHDDGGSTDHHDDGPSDHHHHDDAVPPPPPPPPPTTTTTAPVAVAAPPPAHSEVGEATWYSAASAGMCASPSLPFGTVLTVTNDSTGASTTCTVDDGRGGGIPSVGGHVAGRVRADRRPERGSGRSHNLLVTLSGADITELLAARGLRPNRALGQNFVADANTVRRIARLSGVGVGSSVLEIGAGLGSLTLALAETGARVVAIETDHHLVPVLTDVVEPVGAEVVPATS